MNNLNYTEMTFKELMKFRMEIDMFILKKYWWILLIILGLVILLQLIIYRLLDK